MRWGEVTAEVIQPNIECTNGVIHLVDKVFIDDAPPWTVGAANAACLADTLLLLLATAALRRIML